MKYHLNWQARAVDGNTASSWFKAEVPGNVQYDYGCFMGWGDISEGENVMVTISPAITGDLSFVPSTTKIPYLICGR